MIVTQQPWHGAGSQEAGCLVDQDGHCGFEKWSLDAPTMRTRRQLLIQQCGEEPDRRIEAGHHIGHRSADLHRPRLLSPRHAHEPAPSLRQEIERRLVSERTT